MGLLASLVVVLVSGCIGDREVVTAGTCDSLLDISSSALGAVVAQRGLEVACTKHCGEKFSSTYKDWKCNSDGYVTCICE